MDAQQQERATFERKPKRVRLKDGQTADYVEAGTRPNTHVVKLDSCGCVRTVHLSQIKYMA